MELYSLRSTQAGSVKPELVAASKLSLRFVQFLQRETFQRRADSAIRIGSASSNRHGFDCQFSVPNDKVQQGNYSETWLAAAA